MSPLHLSWGPCDRDSPFPHSQSQVTLLPSRPYLAPPLTPLHPLLPPGQLSSTPLCSPQHWPPLQLTSFPVLASISDALHIPTQCPKEAVFQQYIFHVTSVQVSRFYPGTLPEPDFSPDRSWRNYPAAGPGCTLLAPLSQVRRGLT